MRKKMMISMIAIALVALVFFAGYGVMSETMVQADIDLVGEATPAESAITEPEIDAVTVVAAETEYEALLERAKGIEEKYGLEQQSDEEMQAADMERKKLSKDFARYYETYGWDQYDGDVYEREILTEMAGGAIDGLGDIIYMIENGIMSPPDGQTKEAFLAIFERRIEMNNAFLEKVAEADDADMRALSGEFRYMYELYECGICENEI